MSSVNDIIDQINRLSGTKIPSSSVNVTSGALSPAPYPTASLYIPATAPYGTIPTDGIYPGGIITSQQILRIINALNGVNVDTIIISGSLLTSGSNVLDGTLALPFIEEGNFLYVSGGLIQGRDSITSASFAVSSSYATTSSLPLLGIVTASVAANTLTFTKGDQTTFDIVISQSGSVESASYAAYAQNAGTASYALTASYVNPLYQDIFITGTLSVNGDVRITNIGGFYGTNFYGTNFFGTASAATSASYASTASYVAGLNFATNQIATGSVTASVNINPASLFLIQSQSVPFFNIAADSSTTVYSDLFIIKGFTSQQPVLTVSESIVNIATHSIDPSGTTVAGNIYFTSTAMYIGLE
jgi:hypothetical protein